MTFKINETINLFADFVCENGGGAATMSPCATSWVVIAKTKRRQGNNR